MLKSSPSGSFKQTCLGGRTESLSSLFMSWKVSTISFGKFMNVHHRDPVRIDVEGFMKPVKSGSGTYGLLKVFLLT